MHSRRTQVYSLSSFTLIELLVVIGVVGLLLAMLLPVIAGARRQAGIVRCAACLCELHQAFELYALDYKGYWPPLALRPRADLTYAVGDDTFPIVDGGFRYPALWHNFLAPYVAQTKQGFAARTPQDLAAAKTTIVWGCPQWDLQTSIAQPNRCGYGMNTCPLASATNPPIGGDFPPYPIHSLIDWPGVPGLQAWFKASAWTHPAQRALLADSGTMTIWSKSAPVDHTFPPQLVISETDWSLPLAGETQIDVYRHGQYPPVLGILPGAWAPVYSAAGGKVAYNILDSDGHVMTHTDQSDAYRAVRMRYPG